MRFEIWGYFLYFLLIETKIDTNSFASLICELSTFESCLIVS